MIKGLRSNRRDIKVFQGDKNIVIDTIHQDRDIVDGTITDVNLSTYTAVFQIRQNYADFDNTVIFEADHTDHVSLNHNSQNGRIQVVIPSSDSATFDFKNNKARYDLKIIDNTDESTTIQYGIVDLIRSVSRIED